MIVDSGERTKFASGAVRDMHNEVWRQVVGYEGLYEVSDRGRVRSLRTATRITDKDNKIMKQKDDGHGYFRVNLYKNGKCKAELVSRIVAKAFIPNADELPHVGHDDDNKKNNTVENLYWTNPAENHIHNNLHLKIRDSRQKNIQRVVDALSVPVIATNIKTGEETCFSSMREACRQGHSSGHISQCCNGKRMSHHGYTWRKGND